MKHEEIASFLFATGSGFLKLNAHGLYCNPSRGPASVWARWPARMDLGAERSRHKPRLMLLAVR